MKTYQIKCKGYHCPQKYKCSRYTSEANQPYQEYFSRIPVLSSGYCRFFVQSSLPDPVEVFIEQTETVVKKPVRMKAVAKKAKRKRVVK